MSDTHCPLPWAALEVDAMGNIKPCCLAEVPIANIKESSLSDAMQSPILQGIRDEMSAGKRPAACKKCWEAEDAKHISKRQHALLKFKRQQDVQLKFLDMKLGNICNIKCRICGETSSSQWATETYKNTGDKQRYQIISTAGRWPRESPAFWSEIKEQLSSIEELEITGGEPLLIEEQFDVLRTAVELGVARNIAIHYNTNGTVYPEHALAELWPHFKKVELAFSIDNTGERFGYERSPAKWTEVADNFARINKLRLTNRWLQTQICCTVNKFNIYYLPEISEYLQNARPNTWYYNLLHSEEMYNISYLNPKAKAVIKERIETVMSSCPYYLSKVRPIINFMMVDREPNDAAFLKRTAEVDGWRNQSLAITHPELYALLDEKT